MIEETPLQHAGSVEGEILRKMQRLKGERGSLNGSRGKAIGR